MSEIERYKDQLLFDTQKAFWDERGGGSKYRLTVAGVDFFKDKIADLSDLESIRKYLVEHKFVETLSYEYESAIALKLTYTKSCLQATLDGFFDRGLQPICDPIANLFMHAIELKTGLSPERLPIEKDGDTYVMKLAMIATADVVDKMEI